MKNLKDKLQRHIYDERYTQIYSQNDDRVYWQVYWQVHERVNDIIKRQVFLNIQTTIDNENR